MNTPAPTPADLAARLLEHAAVHDAETSPYSPEQAQWAADLRAAAAALSSPAPTPPSSWDEWAMKEAARLWSLPAMPRSQLTATLHCSLIEAMRFASSPAPAQAAPSESNSLTAAANFQRACSLLPEGISWGDTLTPAIALQIAAAAAPVPAAPVVAAPQRRPGWNGPMLPDGLTEADLIGGNS